MKRFTIVGAFALVAIAATGALAQQTTSPKPAKAAANASVKAERDTLKAINADQKSTKRALKAAKVANDTAKVRQLTQELAKDKADKKALKAKLPPRKGKPAKTKP